MRDLLNHLITSYQALMPESTIFDNAKDQPLDDFPRLQLYTGMRGTGKTSQLQTMLRNAMAAGVPKERTLYLDLADARLCRANAREILPCAVDAFLERFPRARHDTMYFAFDNIGHIPEWASFASKLQDTYDVRIVAADAKKSWLNERNGLPSKTIVEELHGASFNEMRTTLWERKLYDSADQESRETSDLRSYLQSGGLSCAHGTEDFHLNNALQRHFNLIVTNDILRIAPQTNASLCMIFGSLALDSTARKLSITKACSALKEQGLPTTRNTLSSLLNQLEDAHVIHTVKEFNCALSENPRTPRTVYAGDHGLAQAFASSGALDAQRLAATVTYLGIRRKDHLGDIFSYRTDCGNDVLFACGNPESGCAFSLTHVCVEDSDQKALNKAQETLLQAMAETGLKHATLITSSTTSTVRKKNGTIELVPLRSWLADDTLI